MPITILIPTFLTRIIVPEEQLLTENPVLSNLQQVKNLDHFIRSLLSSQTVMTSDLQIERFLGKSLEIMSPLSLSCKRLEDIRKAPSHVTVEVLVDKFVTLAEEAILFLSQASLSVSYNHRANILKMITKDP